MSLYSWLVAFGLDFLPAIRDFLRRFLCQAGDDGTPKRRTRYFCACAALAA